MVQVKAEELQKTIDNIRKHRKKIIICCDHSIIQEVIKSQISKRDFKKIEIINRGPDDVVNIKIIKL